MLEPLVITEPTYEPITYEELKNQARIDTDNDDQQDLIENIFIPAARDYLESRTERTFHQKTLEWAIDEWPANGHIRLPRATPLISVTWVKYFDSDGTENTWATSEYHVDTDSLPGRVVLAYGLTWPSFTKRTFSPIRIRYVAGIQTVSPLTEAPATVKYAMVLLVAAMWRHREAIIVSDRASASQIAVQTPGVEALIEKLKVEYAF